MCWSLLAAAPLLKLSPAWDLQRSSENPWFLLHLNFQNREPAYVSLITCFSPSSPWAAAAPSTIAPVVVGRSQGMEAMFRRHRVACLNFKHYYFATEPVDHLLLNALTFIWHIDECGRERWIRSWYLGWPARGCCCCCRGEIKAHAKIKSARIDFGHVKVSRSHLTTTRY